ncbi:MAG: hypothetical protein CM15mP49_23560 [Actinomycetota bacterium]|nr:MAG: hypothetical protein CM15mP49_23560 [Actinomycetota bacterium]
MSTTSKKRAKWNRVTGAGPFFVTKDTGATGTYTGEEMTVPLDYGFGYHGDTHVQFIQQNDEGPSIYRDMFQAGEEGFHHIGCSVPDDDIEKKVRNMRPQASQSHHHSGQSQTSSTLTPRSNRMLPRTPW